jgi:hypothetical protein
MEARAAVVLEEPTRVSFAGLALVAGQKQEREHCLEKALLARLLAGKLDSFQRQPLALRQNSAV